MKFNDINPAVDLDNDEVLVRFFGPLELENKWGRICEPRTKPWALSWIILKYLLVNSNRTVQQEEFDLLAWPGQEATVLEGALRTRLRRVRMLLEPLNLGDIHGLLLFSQGTYTMNPDYHLITDVDAFTELMSRIEKLPLDSQEGMDCCIEAVDLCRGVYLSYSSAQPWVRTFQRHYQKEFCKLAESLLLRMKAMGDNSAAGLLWRRAIVVVPEAEDLHKKIISFLTEQKLDTEILHYTFQLSRTGAGWLEELGD